MNPLAWMLGLALPACGFPGTQGLPTPPPMDTAQITRPASPNTALAAPDGFNPAPDIVTPGYPVPAARLLELIQAVAAVTAPNFPGGALSGSPAGALRRS